MLTIAALVALAAGIGALVEIGLMVASDLRGENRKDPLHVIVKRLLADAMFAVCAVSIIVTACAALAFLTF